MSTRNRKAESKDPIQEMIDRMNKELEDLRNRFRELIKRMDEDLKRLGIQT